jgi:2-dehydropantoate 2-reductase
MRYIMYGAGAIGATIGARLFEAGHEVVLIARGEHARAMERDGLRFGTPAGEVTLRIPVAEHPARIAWRDDDVVFLTMKSQDTASALHDLAAAAPEHVAVVCAQNGVENERQTLRRFANVHAMCIMLPATYLEPGVVFAHGVPQTGILDVGRYPSGSDEVDAQIARDLEGAHFSSEPRADVMRWKYTKLLMNLGNALEAACGRAARASALFARAKAEAVACFDAAGIAFASDEEDAARRAGRMAIHTGGTVEHRGGSSWQSLVRGTGSIEADYLNGEIVLLGRLHGVPTPVNAMLQRLANRMAVERIAPGSLQLADLEAELLASAPAG